MSHFFHLAHNAQIHKSSLDAKKKRNVRKFHEVVEVDKRSNKVQKLYKEQQLKDAKIVTTKKASPETTCGIQCKSESIECPGSVSVAAAGVVGTTTSKRSSLSSSPKEFFMNVLSALFH
jgi:hypothetical protein